MHACRCRPQTSKSAYQQSSGKSAKAGRWPAPRCVHRVPRSLERPRSSAGSLTRRPRRLLAPAVSPGDPVQPIRHRPEGCPTALVDAASAPHNARPRGRATALLATITGAPRQAGQRTDWSRTRRRDRRERAGHGSSQLQQQCDRPADGADGLEAGPFIEAACRVVLLDAQADPRHPAATRPCEESVEKPRPDALASPLLHQPNRQFRRRGIDKAEAWIAVGKESEPRRADRASVLFSDNSTVARPRPARNIVRELRLSHDLVHGPGRSIGSPECGCHHHLGQEGRIGRARRAKDDNHKADHPLRTGTVAMSDARRS